MLKIFKIMLICLALCAGVAQAEELVGEVRSVIGVAQIIDTAGTKQTITSGASLRVGDSIQTDAGSHVHLRMVDGALLSLRPDSELKISSYTYRPGEPGQTKIRFDLLRGTVRSVTGKGGELAKEKFRMNTPVAAIAVRGTDFVAQTDKLSTRVNVQFGAIVFAPLGVGCDPSSLGSCRTAAARVLSADMSNMMLELAPGISVPRLVPLTDRSLLIPKPDKAATGGQTVVAEAAPEVLNNKPNMTTSNQNSMISAMLANKNYKQLVWGVWAGGAPGDDLHTPYPFAKNGREAVVGTGAILFRDSQGASQMPTAGRADFSLRLAEVSMNQHEVITSGLVQSGTLGVDFSQSTYTTQLNVQHPSLSTVATLNVSGSLQKDGLLSSATSGSGTVVGTLSRNTLEAGYQFKMPTAVGELTGTTLWSR